MANGSHIVQTGAEIQEVLARAGLQFVGHGRDDARATAGQAAARYYDHTLLKPQATRSQFEQLCREARQWGVASVCLPPNRVALAAEMLADSDVKVCTVIGFPCGYATAAAKRAETHIALTDGCREFDMVVPIGMVKDRDVLGVYNDVRAVVEAAEGQLVKVILETALLNDQEKIFASLVAIAAGAAMLKTSTGFADKGATIADLQLMRSLAGDTVGVKASGGIRDAEFAAHCLAAGADRIGASATGSILGMQSV